MAGELINDKELTPIQVFAPSKVVTGTIVGTSWEWVPDSSDLSFWATADVEIKFTPKDGEQQAAFTLPAFVACGISPGTVFEFTDNSVNVIVVM